MMLIAWALLTTEAIKLRRTLALWLAVAAPVFAILLELISLLDRSSFPSGDAVAVWPGLLQSGWGLWLGFFAPMLICFEAASLANLEHGGRLWKQLFTYPIPRWSVYATKILFCGLLVGAGFVILALGYAGDASIVSGVYGWQLASSIPLAAILLVAGKAYLASCLVIVVQTWLSMRFSRIVAPVGIGFAGLVMGFVLLGVVGRREENSLFWYPWLSALATISGGSSDRHNTLVPMVIGCGGGVVLGALACWDLARRREGE